MAQVLKCDRCGNIYDLYNTMDNVDEINGLDPLNIQRDRTAKRHSFIDLCPKCAESFNNWLQGARFDESDGNDCNRCAYGPADSTDYIRCHKCNNGSEFVVKHCSTCKHDPWEHHGHSCEVRDKKCGKNYENWEPKEDTK